jgi:hypothetical protein
MAVGAAPLKGQALLDDISKRAVTYFWQQSNPTTGLTKDRAANFKDADDHVVASVAATGYALSAYAIGAHRGWLPRSQAIARTRMTLHWLRTKGLKEHGWFYHFIDWRTGERVWKSEASSIDTCLLIAGAVIAQQEFHDSVVDSEFKKILAEIDWKWMLTSGGDSPDSALLCMGWHPEDGFINAHWDHYYECTFLFVQMLGLDPHLPADKAWKAVQRDPYTYGGYPHLTGGCIFMHQMSQDFVDFRGQRDMLGYDYWVEGRNACLANRQYCIDNPKKFAGYGPNVWGLNAGDGPSGYEGNSPNGSDDGTISPTGAICSVLYTPDIAKSTADNLITTWPKSYGKYGFANGINPNATWIGPDVIGIDLGMVLLSIEDARDHLPQKLSLMSPIYKLGLKRAGFHKTEEGPLVKRKLQID